MSRPTVSRKALRRAIALDMVMPFFIRYEAGESTITSIAGVSLVDTSLSQVDGFWVNQWVYAPTLNKAYRIIDYTKNSHTLVLEQTSASLIAGLKYEIHQGFSPLEINQAINRAMRLGYPDFFDTSKDTSLVLCRDKLEYDISTLSPSAAMILGVSLERPSKRVYGKIDSLVDNGTTVTITDADLNLSEVTNSWLVSFFNGAGSGGWSTLSVVGTHSFTCDDQGELAGTEFMLWDPNYQTRDWFDVRTYNVDVEEFPTYIRFNYPEDYWVGSRIQIMYGYRPEGLSTDADLTVVPEGYLVPQALSILASTRINDSRYDRQKFAIIAQDKKAEAEEYRNKNYFRVSGVKIRLGKSDIPTNIDYINGDPLGWNSHE